jgi:hypothetical protein
LQASSREEEATFVAVKAEKDGKERDGRREGEKGRVEELRVEGRNRSPAMRGAQ